MPTRYRFGLWLCLALLTPATASRAAGPLFANGAGQPYVWTQHPIPYNPDRGDLGALDNSSAVAFVSARFATWAAVPTTSVSFTNAGLLPVDVTAANVSQYFGVCGDTLNPVIFDTDGSIIRALFGIGNENFILGAAGPECGTDVPPVITEAGAILNGRFLDGVNSQLNPEVTLADFNGVFTHEFGHFFGLDHSQINLTEAFDTDVANDTAVATMFPILINGTEQAALNLDDRVSVSMLYPSATFFSASGSIRGAVLRQDGTTPFQGAYVIARKVSNPRIDAVGVVSGYLFYPGMPGGPPPASLKGSYELDGLTPGASYSVEIESVSPLFTGGSGVGPLDPPAVVPVPEFWNGANEAATNPPDNPSASTPVVVGAGVPVTGINITLNAASGALPTNDLCGNARLIASFPFNDSADTSGAGESASDPGQSCTAGQKNFNTVWYAIVPQQDGMVSVDTCGSDYDTVLTAYAGTCSSLAAVACNDDVGTSDPACNPLQSRINFDVQAGRTYLVEVTQFGTPQGGNLTVNATLTMRDCLGGGCLAGSLGSRSLQCTSEWLIEPPPLPPKPSASVITCNDGDACDLDNSGTNQSCTFHLAVCLNNHDPNVSCAPTDVTTVELLNPSRNRLQNKPEDTANADALLASIAGASTSGQVRGICRNNTQLSCLTNTDCNSPGKNDGRCYVFVRFDPAAVQPDRCGVSADIVVPLRSLRGGFAPVSKRIQLRATTSAGKKDMNYLTLRCLPSL